MRLFSTLRNAWLTLEDSLDELDEQLRSALRSPGWFDWAIAGALFFGSLAYAFEPVGRVWETQFLGMSPFVLALWVFAFTYVGRPMRFVWSKVFVPESDWALANGRRQLEREGKPYSPTESGQ